MSENKFKGFMEKPHSFFPSEAKKYGVNKAILLYNIRFWLDKNKSNEKNIHDAYYWTYNSSRAFSKLFPYMKEGSIKNWLKELEDVGVLKSGNYNKSPYDKTKWYTIPSEYPIALTVQSEASEMQSKELPMQSEASGVPPISDVNTVDNPDKNTDGQKAVKKTSSRCSLEELIDYAIGKANTLRISKTAAENSAINCYSHYEALNWKDKTGNTVTNLKSKWLRVWGSKLPKLQKRQEVEEFDREEYRLGRNLSDFKRNPKLFISQYLSVPTAEAEKMRKERFGKYLTKKELKKYIDDYNGK